MNPAFVFFLISMLGVCAFAVLRGGRDERLGAIALAAAAIASPLAVSHSWGGPELGVVLVDLGLLAALIMLAMRSRAFWPMWAAGFQGCAVAVHLVAARSPTMLPAVYAETLAVWAYPVLAALAAGTWLETRVTHGRS
jgi:hypothetical protein